MDISRIKSRAKEKGKTLAHLCALFDLNRGYLHDVGKKDLDIEPERLQIIADDLDTTVDYLTFKSDEKEKPTLTINENGLDPDLVELMKQLTPDETRLVLAQLRGIISSRGE